MSLDQHFHKPKPIPLLMSLSAIILLFGLGIWQLQRLAWKEALIADIERAAQETPLQGLPQSVEEMKARRFHIAELTGEYLPEPELHLAARYFRSQLGYSVFNPFRLTDGRIVLVNRGWIPAQRKSADKHPAAPTGPQMIRVQIRTSNERNYFTPENQPQKNVWFGRDVDAMGEYARLSVLPISLDVVGTQSPDILPVPSEGMITLRNDHLGYAITWFGVGLAVLVISVLYHRKKSDNPPSS